MFESILYSLNNPIVVLDKKNLIVFVNPAFEELLSISKSILVNKKFNLFLDDYSALFLLLNRVRKSKSSLSEDSLLKYLTGQRRNNSISRARIPSQDLISLLFKFDGFM